MGFILFPLSSGEGVSTYEGENKERVEKMRNRELHNEFFSSHSSYLWVVLYLILNPKRRNQLGDRGKIRRIIDNRM
jgi:hypothetical protein